MKSEPCEISRKNLSPTNRVWNSILVACARKRRRGGQYFHRQRGEGDFATEEIFSPPPNVYMRKQSEREICLVLSTQLYFGFSTQQQIDDGTTKFLWSLEAASRYSLSGLFWKLFYVWTTWQQCISLSFFKKITKRLILIYFRGTRWMSPSLMTTWSQPRILSRWMTSELIRRELTGTIKLFFKMKTHTLPFNYT